MDLIANNVRLDDTEFKIFAIDARQRLQRSLVARYGLDVGMDATEDCLVFAWEHWERIRSMANPVGYLWRVGRSSANKQMGWRRRAQFPPEGVAHHDSTTVDLSRALARLHPAQRTCVLLVHGHGWSYAEVADHLGVSVPAVTNHVHRGLKALRDATGEIK